MSETEQADETLRVALAMPAVAATIAEDALTAILILRLIPRPKSLTPAIQLTSIWASEDMAASRTRTMACIPRTSADSANDDAHQRLKEIVRVKEHFMYRAPKPSAPAAEDVLDVDNTRSVSCAPLLPVCGRVNRGLTMPGEAAPVDGDR
jgi:hypothetical protein